jgi:glycosyltransferase involved in cell wall biosynthesis
MTALLHRRLIETEDWLRYQPNVRDFIGRYKAWRALRRIPTDAQSLARSIHNLCAAARLLRDPAKVHQLEQRIAERATRIDPRRVDWSEFVPRVENTGITRAALLKPCLGAREKGIIYIGFETEWLRFVHHVPLAPFAERYTLILAPSSNPYNLINCVVPAAYPGSLYSLINHDEDVDILHRIAPSYRVVPMYTSHWVNPTIYEPRPRGLRDIDLLMVAAWGKVKRHHLLFEALRRMPSSLRVVLIGQDQDGRTQETMRREAAYYGVADRFEMRSNLSHAQVRDAFCRAKISILLSLREGSAVVVPESLFADTPVGLLQNADNGSRGFINDQTGRLLCERDLAGQLSDFLANADRCNPRGWAEANISCFKSTERLNAILRADALAAGQEWTRDIHALCWQPDPRLVYPADWQALAGERAEFRTRFGVELGPAELQ